jgi:hypothetical protein
LPLWISPARGRSQFDARFVAPLAARGEIVSRQTTKKRNEREAEMTVAKVSEISVTSSKGFQDAIEKGIARSHKTLRNVRSAWIKEQQVRVKDGVITEFQVNMKITFVVDDLSRPKLKATT